MEGKTVAATKACCPDCSTEQFSEIANIIDLYKDKEGSLIQVLHRAQEIYGYLPLELQSFIADGMGLPLSEVSGVVTFYSFFSTKPRGKHTIRICMGTACYVRGGKKLVDTTAGHPELKDRRHHGGRHVYVRSRPLHRRVRPCPRHHGGRYGIQAGHPQQAQGDTR